MRVKVKKAKKMSAEAVLEARKLEKQLDKIVNLYGFNEEAETIIDGISWYCVQHNISPNVYKMQVFFKN